MTKLFAADENTLNTIVQRVGFQEEIIYSEKILYDNELHLDTSGTVYADLQCTDGNIYGFRIKTTTNAHDILVSQGKWDIQLCVSQSVPIMRADIGKVTPHYEPILKERYDDNHMHWNDQYPNMRIALRLAEIQVLQEDSEDIVLLNSFHKFLTNDYENATIEDVIMAFLDEINVNYGDHIELFFADGTRANYEQ